MVKLCTFISRTIPLMTLLKEVQSQYLLLKENPECICTWNDCHEKCYKLLKSLSNGGFHLQAPFHSFVNGSLYSQKMTITTMSCMEQQTL